MNDFINAAHEVYELTQSDLTVLLITAFISGVLVSDGFKSLIIWIIKKVHKSPA